MTPEEEYGPVVATIKPAAVQDENGQPLSYSANLKRWLSSDIRFHHIEQAIFTEQMVLGTVEFDRDHTFYVLIPRTVFQGEAEA